MNAKHEERLRKLKWDDIRDWVDDRTAQRGWQYRDKVGEIVALDDCLAAKVRGTEEYTTNLSVDSYGELVSVCTCPVGRNCKHGVALALRASEALKAGRPFPVVAPEGWRLDREAILAARRPTAKKQGLQPTSKPEVIRIRVETNPFDRFTSAGGRHARDFSFRVAAKEEVFHWSFVIPSLIYLLAKGGLDYDDGKDTGGKNNDWPLFTCTCGSAGCLGLDRQSCSMTLEEVMLTIVQYRRTIVFSFDRARFEYWSMLALRRMRGSARFRGKPWSSVLRLDVFDDALETLLAMRPRCRAIWQRLKTKRRFDEQDFSEFAAISPGEIAPDAVREAFVPVFDGVSKTDLREPGVLFEEKRRVAGRLKEETASKLPQCIYGTLFGKGWKPVELRRGLELAFVREPADDKGRPIICVMDAATNEILGHLKYDEARFLTALMDRRGMILRNHVEQFERFGKALPIRIDFEFRDQSDQAIDWGDSLVGKERLYFEMLRAVAIRPGIVSAAELRGEIETFGRILQDVTECPEIAFLTAWILASARGIEVRLTADETEKRRAYCDAVRRALVCEPVGGLLPVGEVMVLPLRAPIADSSLPRDEILDRVRSWIRLSWYWHDLPRPRVELPEFPPEATGFAAFRGHELLDVCLTGIPLSGSDLFDNFALYDRPSETSPLHDEREAFAVVTDFLAALPIRERDKNGRAPSFWLERGIHNGTYEIDEAGRLVALRIIRMIARKQWVD